MANHHHIINRRAILGTALAIPGLLAAPALAEQASKDADWANLREQARWFHPDGPAVVARARAAGLDVEQYAGMSKEQRGIERGRLYLLFGVGSAWQVVDIDGVQ